jgi:hypothetical protein
MKSSFKNLSVCFASFGIKKSKNNIVIPINKFARQILN